MARENKVTILFTDEELARVKAVAERDAIPLAVLIRSAILRMVPPLSDD